MAHKVWFIIHFSIAEFSGVWYNATVKTGKSKAGRSKKERRLAQNYGSSRMALNPRFIIQIYPLHHRWKVAWATPSFFAAALPLISPRRQAAVTLS